jgi:hypothetical protein
MLVEVGQKYTRKGKTYSIKRLDYKGQFTYVWVLEESRSDLHENNHSCKVYGMKVFTSEFNLKKGDKNG